MCNISHLKIREMWEEFKDVPVNEKDEIERDFYQWQSGTDRFEIWHWFDENHSTGLHTLMYR